MKTNQNIIGQLAEVRLVYNTNIPAHERIHLTSSKSAQEVLLANWSMDSIEYREEFKILLLNRANRLLGLFVVSTGGISGTVVDVRMIFQAALKANASAIILAHNHPSGNFEPSSADLQITRKIKDAGNLLDITVLDHLIITKESGYYSMADNGNF
jgi:DNA repair protein RadC